MAPWSFWSEAIESTILNSRRFYRSLRSLQNDDTKNLRALFGQTKRVAKSTANYSASFSFSQQPWLFLFYLAQIF